MTYFIKSLHKVQRKKGTDLTNQRTEQSRSYDVGVYQEETIGVNSYMGVWGSANNSSRGAVEKLP